jgi:hypothetical protein
VTDIVDVDDLPTALQTAELVELMVAGANAKASRVAPCLAWTGTPTTEPAPSADQLAEAKLILVGAIKRWSEASSGALQAQQAGPFGQTIDTRQRTGYNLWPSEIEQLQAICATGSVGREAFSIDTAPCYSVHLPWCSINFSATYCSCGVDIAGEPIYELG